MGSVFSFCYLGMSLEVDTSESHARMSGARMTFIVHCRSGDAAAFYVCVESVGRPTKKLSSLHCMFVFDVSKSLISKEPVTRANQRVRASWTTRIEPTLTPRAHLIIVGAVPNGETEPWLRSVQAVDGRTMDTQEGRRWHRSTRAPSGSGESARANIKLKKRSLRLGQARAPWPRVQ